MTRIIVFASGSGSNAENIITYFKNHEKIRVAKVLCNRKDAKVFERFQRSKTLEKMLKFLNVVNV